MNPVYYAIIKTCPRRLPSHRMRVRLALMRVTLARRIQSEFETLWRQKMRSPVLMSCLLLIGMSSLSVAQKHDTEELVRKIKAEKLSIDRPYQIGAEVILTLAPGEAARLDVGETAAVDKEILLWYDGKILHVIHCCIDGEINHSHLSSERPGDYRIRCPSETPVFIEYTTKCNFRQEKAVVTFSAKSPSEQKRKELGESWKERQEKRKHRQAIRERALAVRQWDFEQEIAPFEITMSDPSEPGLAQLREEYDLEQLAGGAADDPELLNRILRWANAQFQHSGDNKPSKSDPLTILEEGSEGKRFRCVEYSIVVAAAARALGMPSRVLGLKREDVETAEGGAGHVVAEVWLRQHKKWAFVDGQWGVMVERNGVPLNAVEFQDALARESPGLNILCVSQFLQTRFNKERYVRWIAPYLYYFDFNLDQRFFQEDYERRRYDPKLGKIMLVPRGANQPKVFQRSTPIKNCRYISNATAFYPPMSGSQ